MNSVPISPMILRSVKKAISGSLLDHDDGLHLIEYLGHLPKKKDPQTMELVAKTIGVCTQTIRRAWNGKNSRLEKADLPLDRLRKLTINQYQRLLTLVIVECNVVLVSELAEVC